MFSKKKKEKYSNLLDPKTKRINENTVLKEILITMAFQYTFFYKDILFKKIPLETQLFLGRLPGTAEAWQWHNIDSAKSDFCFSITVNPRLYTYKS